MIEIRFFCCVDFHFVFHPMCLCNCGWEWNYCSGETFLSAKSCCFSMLPWRISWEPSFISKARQPLGYSQNRSSEWEQGLGVEAAVITCSSNLLWWPLKKGLGGGGRPTGKSCATFWIWAGWRLCGFHAASLFLPVCKNARWWWLGFHSSKVSEGGSNKSDILGSLHCHSAVTLPRLSRQTSSCIASQVGVNALDFRRGTCGIGAFVCPCQCEGVVAMNHSPNPPVLAQPCLWTKRQSLWKRWGLFPSWWKDYWKDYNIH